MTWLDSAIGWLFPQAGLARARARAALGLVRAYEGAATTRRTANWRTSGASANAEIAGGLARLRNRSRSLVRDNPYARRGVAALVGNAIGTGIALGTDNDQLKKAWLAWTAEADFYGDSDFFGLQALAARAGFESGDCLVVRVRTSAAGAGRSGVPLRLQVLEGDFLDTSKHGPQTNGNYAVAGIEVDRQGRRVAFHVFRTHPGETAVFDPRAESTRVPAEDVIYLFEKERPGQILGVPRLAAGIMKLRDLDEYQEALLVKKKIEACFAAFVATDDDAKLIGTTSSTETDAEGNTRRVEKLEPGQILYGKVGESITFGQPSATADMGFTKDTLHAIAAAVGCTYEQLTGDLSQVNYSSMRGGRAEFKLLIEQYRWLTFVPQFCERVYGWFEEAAYGANRIRTTQYAHTWTPPRWEYVNPMEDVQADKEELGAGLASLSEKLRARGENPEAVFEEIAAERKKLAELGIKVDFSAGGAKAAEKKPKKGAEDGASQGDDDGEEADPDERSQTGAIARAVGEAVALGIRAAVPALPAAPPITIDARTNITANSSAHEGSPGAGEGAGEQVRVELPQAIEGEIVKILGDELGALREASGEVRTAMSGNGELLAALVTRLDALIVQARLPRRPVFNRDGDVIAAIPVDALEGPVYDERGNEITVPNRSQE